MAPKNRKRRTVQFERPPSLTEATAERLREQIVQGDFGQHLPGEGVLAESLGVARVTVRRSLALLAASGIIGTAEQGRPRLILTGAEDRGRKAIGHIGIILRTSRPTLDLHTQEVVTSVVGLLEGAGIKVSVDEPNVQFLKRPGTALTRFLDKHQADIWILFAPSEPVARWFARKEIPAVMCGGPALDAGLPIVAHDGAATIRHAYHLLFRRGHSHISILMPFDRPARAEIVRELHAEAGLPMTGDGIKVYRNDHDELLRTLRRLLSAQHGPSALILSDTAALMALYSVSLELGLRISEDISYLLIYQPAFPDAVLPPPCYYKTYPKKLATSLVKIARQMLARPAIRPDDHFLLMEYVEGGSVSSIGEGRAHRATL